MFRIATAWFLGAALMATNSISAAGPDDVVLIIHGGTGRTRDQLPAEKETAQRAVMAEALKAGKAALDKEGAVAMDGVVAAIIVLEDSPLFNAGRGAVFTADERNELDASIMDGRNLMAGAVAGLTVVKNPILGARAVMEKTPHVLLMGDGANQFCKDQGLVLVDPSYFRTDARLEELRKEQEEEKRLKSQGVWDPTSLGPQEKLKRAEWSTVGAVALGNDGHLAAGTSTGGMTNKRHGRIGDSPIIGAGTYADDRSCAVSCTGHGEFFIRLSVAHTIASLVRYKGLDIQAAVDEAIKGDLTKAEGTGGAIVLDKNGRAAFAYNSPGMWRGTITRGGKIDVAVYEK
jgi:beta-aspartyl-peptidase (threonine type)